MQYSWTSAIFYFGYLVWSWPTSYLIVRLPLGKYLAASVYVFPSAIADRSTDMELTIGRFLWGGVLMCHAACKNFSGLMAARFFLGVGEAAIAPGFALLTGMFYKRDEQPLRYIYHPYHSVLDTNLTINEPQTSSLVDRKLHRKLDRRSCCLRHWPYPFV